MDDVGCSFDADEAEAEFDEFELEDVDEEEGEARLDTFGRMSKLSRGNSTSVVNLCVDVALKKSQSVKTLKCLCKSRRVMIDWQCHFDFVLY